MDDTPNKGLHDNHECQEAWTRVRNQKWDHSAVKQDESHKGIAGAEYVKVLEYDQVSPEVGAANVLGATRN